ncbi:MAG TPA: HAMP domain-containing sensor histidine kinase [Candidatus Paceibacterota bacterium]|nr:HAMP domain-containing sensor histidine kinase [Verrucomicrobiota bacterium]HSA11558.1 HAMP domain-containing sensor histidine kinase [Candidatus Paceibacterota bacterium]
MKAIRAKLAMGGGRPSGSWLMLLLLLAVLVPSVCLLWFMSQAAHNERLAARQKLADAYRVNLGLAQKEVEGYWARTIAELETDAERLTPAALFAKTVRAGLAEAVVCVDAEGKASYPGPAPAPEPDAAGADWTEAEKLEQSDPAGAAAAFARLAAQATDSCLAARGLQAQARCLVKAGKREEALAVLTGPLAEERFRAATDAQGRLVAPNAELMAVELLKDSTPERAREPLKRLRQRVLDYDDAGMSAPQRRFLMRELQRLSPDEALQRLLAAEDLAARWVETGVEISPEPGLRGTALPGVWQLACGRGRVLTLHRTEGVVGRMRGAVSAQLLPEDVKLAFVPPGKEFERFLMSVPAGASLSGWRLALSPEGEGLFETAAEQRVTAYVWIGVLVLAAVIVLAALALRLVRRQMALTQLRNDLVANVTHELKTPLSSMRLLVDTLLNSQPLHEQTAREYLQLIAQENLRLSRLIDNFLTFSRMERNKYSFGFKEVPAAVIVEGAVTAVRERFNASGCEFKTEVPPALPEVMADPDAMVTALVNLLDNAYKYSGEEKQITLSAGAANGSVFFAVKDNGIGLSPRDTRRIFRRFFQVDQRLSRSGGGCGLGLSIVKFIVTAHHGSVRVESQPGRGSTFIISLPRAAARPDPEQKPLPNAG